MAMIYLVRCTLGEEVTHKIGYTTRKAVDRIREMETGNPGLLEVVCTYEVSKDLAPTLEAIVQRSFIDRSVRGEWFDSTVTEEEFRSAADEASKNLSILNDAGNPFVSKKKLKRQPW
jgi:carboxypeptidase C (cathepsin A)